MAKKQSIPKKTNSIAPELFIVEGIADSRERRRRLVSELLKRKDKVEALSWLKGSSLTLEESSKYKGRVKSYRNLAEWPTEQSVAWIQELYTRGAMKVWAVNFDRNQPYESINTLIVTLPEERKMRRAVFEWTNKQIMEDGFDPEDDCGQRHLFVWFD